MVFAHPVKEGLRFVSMSADAVYTEEISDYSMVEHDSNTLGRRSASGVCPAIAERRSCCGQGTQFNRSARNATGTAEEVADCARCAIMYVQRDVRRRRCPHMYTSIEASRPERLLDIGIYAARGEHRSKAVLTRYPGFVPSVSSLRADRNKEYFV